MARTREVARWSMRVARSGSGIEGRVRSRMSVEEGVMGVKMRWKNIVWRTAGKRG